MTPGELNFKRPAQRTLNWSSEVVLDAGCAHHVFWIRKLGIEFLNAGTYAKQFCDCSHSALGGLAVTVRVNSVSHLVVSSFIMQQLGYRIEDALLIGTDQSNSTSSHSFRTLGVQAHHENRLAEAWCLFLYSTGIGQHNAGCVDDASEFAVSQWL